MSAPDRQPPLLLYPHGLPQVMVDPRLVRRVLHNLVTNAYKHTGARARVVLAATSVDNMVRFAVEDDGPGVPMDQRHRVFERFVQMDGAGPGSGLGLAFCKLVVEHLGGRIWIEDAVPQGTRVCFDLPTAESVAAIPALEQAS